MFILEICINEKRHLNERKYLHGILCGEKNPNVQFNIVSEPLAEEMETKECIDVGLVIIFFVFFLSFIEEIIFNFVFLLYLSDMLI